MAAITAPTTSRDHQRLGLVFAALCATNGAFVPAFAKLTTNQSDPLFVATATSCFAGLLAALVLGAQRQLGVLVGRRTGPTLLAVGALGTAIAFVLFYSGASRSTAIETVLCLQIEPAYSLVVSWLFLGHRPTPRRGAATAALLAGIFLAVGGGKVVLSAGAWLLLATPLCWQVSHLIVLRGMGGVQPSIVTGARYIYGGLLLAAYWLASGGASSLGDTRALPSLLPLLSVQGFVLSYVGTLLWYSTIARLDLGRSTAIVVPSIPLLSLLASFLLLGEVPTGAECMGLALVAAGVLVFVTAPEAIDTRERIPSLTAPVAVVGEDDPPGPV